MKNLILALFLSLALTSFVVGQKNQTTVVHNDQITQVVYKVGGFTMTDSTGSYRSLSIPIADLNDSDGYFQITIPNIAGTEDVNVFFEYSQDGTTWTAGTTDSDLDAVGTTTINDTLGIANGTDQLLFHNSMLMRVHLDGQTGNPQTVPTCYLVFKKDSPTATLPRPALRPTFSKD